MTTPGLERMVIDYPVAARRGHGPGTAQRRPAHRPGPRALQAAAAAASALDGAGEVERAWTPAQSELHPRKADGEFARKGAGSTTWTKFMRSLRGVEHVAATAEDAQRLPADSPNWHQLSGGGSGAGVRMAILPDGRRVVHKQAPDWGSDEPRTTADAEQLASLTARALGVRTAGVYRDDRNSVWVEHVPGNTLGRLDEVFIHTHGVDEGAAQRYQESRDEFLRGPAGARMGLLDVLIGNNDRNEGNLMTAGPGQDWVGIDHAYAYEMLGYSTGTPHPTDLGRMGGVHAPARRYIGEDSDSGGNRWIDNPMTPADVGETRRRLEALRPDYEKLGRGVWFEKMLAMLDQLAEGAQGTESIYE